MARSARPRCSAEAVGSLTPPWSRSRPQPSKTSSVPRGKDPHSDSYKEVSTPPSVPGRPVFSFTPPRPSWRYGVTLAQTLCLLPFLSQQHRGQSLETQEALRLTSFPSTCACARGAGESESSWDGTSFSCLLRELRFEATATSWDSSTFLDGSMGTPWTEAGAVTRGPRAECGKLLFPAYS